MRTKTLFLTAAAIAAGLASSMAQNVYSVNIVGYANNQTTNGSGLALSQGYNLIANQFDLDGTGTNNTLTSVFGTQLPNNAAIQAWNGAGFTQDKWVTSGGGKWASLVNPVVNAAIQPGHGFFLTIPSAATSPNVTTVGNVLVGTNRVTINTGLQIVSPAVPATGGITSTFGYVASKGDAIQIWNPASQAFSQKKYSGSAWSGGEPVFAVGQSMFLNATNAGTWTQVFTVQ
jgi:hypothetical protein